MGGVTGIKHYGFKFDKNGFDNLIIVLADI
jgi:hypothetical protein